MAQAIPVLTYHAVALAGGLGLELFREHLQALRDSGLPCLGAAALAAAPRGYLLTFDDAFADLWTHVLPLLEQWSVPAQVFAIPSRTGDGPPRPRGRLTVTGTSTRAHAEAAQRPGSHPAFLRWSELAALEATGLVTVQSHSLNHAMGWIGSEIVGYHLGDSHWSLSQCSAGDRRLGIPLYRRGSALAHRLYQDDSGLRDRLAEWLRERGGAAYVAERGAAAVAAELRQLDDDARGGRWESEAERRARTLEEIGGAKAALEARLGGARDELCLPWGEYDAVTLECARQAGVRRIYTLDRRPNPAGRIGLRVNRLEPRRRGAAWLRRRLWIYRTTLRAGLYGRLSGRAGPGQW